MSVRVRHWAPYLGRVSERLIEPVLKTGDSNRSVGSNPTSSAIYKPGKLTVDYLANVKTLLTVLEGVAYNQAVFC